MIWRVTQGRSALRPPSYRDDFVDAKTQPPSNHGQPTRFLLCYMRKVCLADELPLSELRQWERRDSFTN